MRTLVLAVFAALSFGSHSAMAQRLERVSERLDHPWGMSFIDENRVLVTERPGHLSLVDLASGKVHRVKGTPKVRAGGQGGMLDVLYDKGDVFLCYSGKGKPRGASTVLGKGRLNGLRLEGFEELFVGEPGVNGLNHFGCRLGFDRQGRLYMTVGERGRQDEAQNPSTHLGTVLRFNRDGSVPADNPFVGQSGFQPEIYTWGHRNPQGLAIHPRTGQIWVNEHGPQGGDEINLITAGANYGWPLYSFGEQYGGGEIGLGTGAPGFADPLWQWTPSIAPSDMTFVPQGSQFPEYEGGLLVTSLKFKRLYHLRVQGERISDQSIVVDGALGRLRDVEVGPDGAIYLLNDEDRGGLYRLSR